MAGKKPKLEQITIEKIKRYAAGTILWILKNKAPDDPIRAQISERIFLRSMPSKIESDGSFAPKTIVLMRNDKATLELKAPETPQNEPEAR